MACTHMLIPIDFSEPAHRALRYALEEATFHHANVTLLYVLPAHTGTDVYVITGGQSDAERWVSVGSMMQTQVITATPTISLAEVQCVMRDSNIRHVPVVSGKRLVGIITDRDLREASPSPATTGISTWSRRPAMLRVGAASIACYVLLRQAEASSVPRRSCLHSWTMFWHDEGQGGAEMHRHAQIARLLSDAQAWTGCRAVGQFVTTGAGAASQREVGSCRRTRFSNVPLRQMSAVMQVWHTFPAPAQRHCHGSRRQSPQAQCYRPRLKTAMAEELSRFLAADPQCARLVGE
jgi:CBS domain-containing protein